MTPPFLGFQYSELGNDCQFCVLFFDVDGCMSIVCAERQVSAAGVLNVPYQIGRRASRLETVVGQLHQQGSLAETELPAGWQSRPPAQRTKLAAPPCPTKLLADSRPTVSFSWRRPVLAIRVRAVRRSTANGCWALRDHETSCESPRDLPAAASTYPRTDRHAHLPDEQTRLHHRTRRSGWRTPAQRPASVAGGRQRRIRSQLTPRSTARGCWAVMQMSNRARRGPPTRFPPYARSGSGVFKWAIILKGSNLKANRLIFQKLLFQ